MSFADEITRWNDRFAGDDYHFGTEPNAFLASQAQRLRAGSSVLCVADGEGRNSVWLAQRGLKVTAFDVSPVGVEKARRLARAAGVTLESRAISVNDWDWDAAHYDAVVAIFIQFANPAERERIFSGMIRALAPGGLLILQGYTPRQLEYRTGGPPFAEHLYTEALLREAFAALTTVVLREYEDEVREGTGHSGHSALIGMVARR